MMRVDLVKRQYELSAESLLLSVGVITFIYCYLTFPIEWVPFIVLMILMQGLLMVWDRFKRVPLFYGVIVLVLLGVYWIFRHNDWSLVNMIGRTYDWVQRYDGTKENYEAVYARVCMIGLIVCVSPITYIGSKVRWIKLGFFVGILASLVFMALQEMQLPKIGLICMLTYSQMGIVEGKHRRHYTSYKTESWKITWTLCPILLGVMLLITILPYRKAPINWSWVHEAIEKTGEGFEDLGSELSFSLLGKSDEFGLNFAGAQEEQKLGGNIGDNDAVMLKTYPLKKVHDSIYLAGNYKDTYTGTSWISAAKGTEGNIEDYKLDTYELLYGLSKRSGQVDLKQLIEESKLKIVYDRIRTRTLFAPSKMEEVALFRRNNDIGYELSGATFPARQKKGSYYTVSFIELNTESDYFRQYVQDVADFSYEEMRPLDQAQFFKQFQGTIDQSTLNRMLNNEAVIKELASRSKKIQEDYLSLPESLPKRISALTNDLTKNDENPYDKLKSIEAYLRTYHYTKSPKKVPDGQDFVDYFLFESKEGYCTYFASAMAVMARTIGIPTRYVEGFVVDYSKMQKKEKCIDVTGQKAHAWVEAYIKGIGWVRFEPSAGYAVRNYSPWQVAGETVAAKATVEEPTENEEIMEQTGLESGDHELEERDSAIHMLIVKGEKGLKVLAVLLVALLGIGWAGISIYNRKYRKASIEQKIRLQFGEVVYILAKMGYPLQDNETLLQFQVRVVHLLGERGYELESIIGVYSRVRYGKAGCGALEEEMATLESFALLCQEFMIRQLESYGKIKRAWWHLTYKLHGYINVK